MSARCVGLCAAAQWDGTTPVWRQRDESHTRPPTGAGQCEGCAMPYRYFPIAAPTLERRAASDLGIATDDTLDDPFFAERVVA